MGEWTIKSQFEVLSECLSVNKITQNSFKFNSLQANYVTTGQNIWHKSLWKKYFLYFYKHIQTLSAFVL